MKVFFNSPPGGILLIPAPVNALRGKYLKNAKKCKEKANYRKIPWGSIKGNSLRETPPGTMGLPEELFPGRVSRPEKIIPRESYPPRSQKTRAPGELSSPDRTSGSDLRLETPDRTPESNPGSNPRAGCPDWISGSDSRTRPPQRDFRKSNGFH